MLQSVRLRGENVWKVFRIMGAQLLKDKGKDMYENKLLTRIRNGKPAYGFSINYPEPAMPSMDSWIIKIYSSVVLRAGLLI